MMFRSATAFNQPLDWNTSQVRYMGSMFEDATSFNKLLIDWDTSEVIIMERMFKGAVSFNQPLDWEMFDWETSHVTNMEQMFAGAIAFNQPLTFDVRQVTTMEQMFAGATAMTYPFPSGTFGGPFGPIFSDDDEEMNVMEEEADPCEDTSRQLCVVCMTSCVDTVLVPCGHACMCHGCTTRVKETSGKCPICRRMIEHINTIIPNIYYAGIARDNDEN